MDSPFDLTSRNIRIMCKPFILLPVLLLCLHAPAAAQIHAPQMILAQEPLPPIVRLASAFVLPPHHTEESSGHFLPIVAGAFEGNYTLERLAPIEEVKTSLLTQWRLPLIQLWGGRLQLDGYMGSLKTQNTQLGPLSHSAPQYFRLSRQSYVGAPRSLDLYGVSLSWHFGSEHAERPSQIWQRLARIVDGLR